MRDLSGVVYGALKSKANSRIATRNGRYIKSKGAQEFTDAAVVQLTVIKNKKLKSPLSGDVGLECIVHYPSKRNDLDVQLFMDCLEKAGVINNDRSIIECYARKEKDAKNPRVEFSIYELQ